MINGGSKSQDRDWCVVVLFSFFNEISYLTKKIYSHKKAEIFSHEANSIMLINNTTCRAHLNALVYPNS